MLKQVHADCLWQGQKGSECTLASESCPVKSLSSGITGVPVFVLSSELAAAFSDALGRISWPQDLVGLVELHYTVEDMHT